MSWVSGTATDYLDFVERLDSFLNKGHALRPDYTGTGTGMLHYVRGTTTSIAETITVVFTSTTAFTVSGSVSGALGSGTADTVFTSSVVSLCVVNLNLGDSTAWQPDSTSFWTTGTPTNWVAGDTASFVMTIPWQTVFKQMTRREAVVSSSNVTYAYNAFDHNASTTTNSNSLPAWIGCKFNKPISLRRFAITPYSTTSYAPVNFTLDYSDDGSTWTTQQAYTANTFSLAGVPKLFDLGSNTPAHLYWRINVTTINSGTSVYIDDIYFIEPNVPDSQMYIYDVSSITQCQILWKAPGDDSLGAIYVGLLDYFNVSNDAWCWRTCGTANYDPLLSNGWPGSQLRAYYGDSIALRNDTIRYWFSATGSFVNLCGNISTVYSHAHMGLLQPYANTERLTYPLVIAGCLAYNATPSRFSITGVGIHQGYWCASSGSGSYNIYVRLLLQDGTIETYRADDYTGKHVHPGCFLSNLNRNTDGSSPMFPVILYSTNAGGYCAGQLRGIQHVSGDGLLSENTLIANRVPYVALQGVYETSKYAYIAYELS